MTADAATLNLRIDQGAYFARTITWETGATFETTDPVDLTGYTARLKVKRSPTATDTLLSLTHASGLTLGGAAGTVAIVMTAAQTASLPTDAELHYDLDLIDGSSRPHRLVRGTIRVVPGVSHQ